MSQSLPEIHAELLEAINEIDATLDSVGDQETATKRRVTNDLVSKNEAAVQPVVDRLSEQLSAMDSDVMAGSYIALMRALKSSFDEKANNVIANLVENAPKVETPQISEEDLSELQKKRSELYQNIKSVVELAKNFTGEELKMPKTRRGAKGPRGPRALNQYDWFINGEAVKEEDNTPAKVAKLLGYEKAADFTKFLREQTIGDKKLDTTNPPDEFEVTLPDGRVISAVRGDEEDDDTTPEAETASE